MKLSRSERITSSRREACIISKQTLGLTLVSRKRKINWCQFIKTLRICKNKMTLTPIITLNLLRTTCSLGTSWKARTRSLGQGQPRLTPPTCNMGSKKQSRSHLLKSTWRAWASKSLNGPCQTLVGTLIRKKTTCQSTFTTTWAQTLGSKSHTSTLVPMRRSVEPKDPRPPKNTRSLGIRWTPKWFDKTLISCILKQQGKQPSLSLVSRIAQPEILTNLPGLLKIRS